MWQESQEKYGSWYAEFNFLGKKEFAALCQARMFSVARLYSKIGRLPEVDLELIRKKITQLFG